MTIPGVGQLTALAFVAAIDEPLFIRDRETCSHRAPFNAIHRQAPVRRRHLEGRRVRAHPAV